MLPKCPGSRSCVKQQQQHWFYKKFVFRMSKNIRVVKKFKAGVVKVKHGPVLHTHIPSGMASAGPPLGSQLGQRNINIAQFCKDFNERTQHFIEGVPLRCHISVNPDRSHNLVIDKPPIQYFVKQAAGCQRGAMDYLTETAGKMTVKHVYEIAKVVSEDTIYDCVPLEKICQKIIDVARRMGIQVVHNLEAEEYRQFLEERKLVNAQQLAEIEEKRQAKLLRTV